MPPIPLYAGRQGELDLIIIDPTAGTYTVVGPTHTDTEFDGKRLDALGYVPPPTVPTTSLLGLAALAAVFLVLFAWRCSRSRARPGLNPIEN